MQMQQTNTNAKSYQLPVPMTKSIISGRFSKEVLIIDFPVEKIQAQSRFFTNRNQHVFNRLLLQNMFFPKKKCKLTTLRRFGFINSSKQIGILSVSDIKLIRPFSPIFSIGSLV